MSTPDLPADVRDRAGDALWSEYLNSGLASSNPELWGQMVDAVLAVARPEIERDATARVEALGKKLAEAEFLAARFGAENLRLRDQASQELNVSAIVVDTLRRLRDTAQARVEALEKVLQEVVDDLDGYSSDRNCYFIPDATVTNVEAVLGPRPGDPAATPTYREDEYGKCTECGHDVGPIGAYCLCDCHEARTVLAKGEEQS